MANSIGDVTGNLLLDGVPKPERVRYLPCLERVSLHMGESLYEPKKTVEYVFFPRSGVVSLMRSPAEGIVVENAAIGREGMVGSWTLSGVDRRPWRTMGQVPGSVLRMTVEDFRCLVQPETVLYRRVLRYLLALLEQMAQGMACNRVHRIEQRLARWLLMTQDRVQEDYFPLTQEFLAQMIGVQRSSVSTVAHSLSESGLIRYQRGLISILDRERLEGHACECYQHLENDYRELLGHVSHEDLAGGDPAPIGVKSSVTISAQDRALG